MNAQDLITLLQDQDVRDAVAEAVIDYVIQLPDDKRMLVIQAIFPNIPWDALQNANLGSVDWDAVAKSSFIPRKKVAQVQTSRKSVWEEIREKAKK